MESSDSERFRAALRGAPVFLIVPTHFEPIPDDLQACVRSLCLAAAALERGEAGHSIDLTWIALETASLWARRVSGSPLQSRRERAHADCKKWVVSELGFNKNHVYHLHRDAMIGGYGSENTIAPGETISRSQAQRAIERVARWLPDLAAYPRTLTTGQLVTLRDSLSLRDVASAHLSDADLAEIVGSGIYDSPQVATFRAMLRRYSRPHTKMETEKAADLAFYAAHQSVNQGICGGPKSSFLWTAAARKLGADINSSERMAQLDRLDSIAHELTGNYPAALRACLSAKEHAAKLPHLHTTMANREARARAKLGEFARARAAAAEAKAGDELERYPWVRARRSLTDGLIASQSGDHALAISLLEEGLTLHQTHQVITRANGEMYLMDAYKGAGQLDKAIHHAKMAYSLAGQYGYRYNLNRIERFYRRLENGRP